MRIRDVTDVLEALAPPSLQESYDNAGLIVGDATAEVTGVLISLDCTEAVVEEAVARGCNLVVSHHPIVFRGLKRLTGRSYVERTVIQAIRHDVALYAIHTNLDNVRAGVNARLGQQLGLEKLRILSPKRGLLRQLTVFVPTSHTEALLEALHAAGAGHVGNYSRCSFQTAGTGRFLPGEDTNPAVGEAHRLEAVAEHRLEVLLPTYAEARVLAAMRAAHPYEEVAYFLASLENVHQDIGSGMIGELPEPVPTRAYLLDLKQRLGLSVLKHTPLPTDPDAPVRRVAFCGGAGGFLLPKAVAQGADVFITADLKYHEYFDADGQIVIADVGHYESERWTSALLRGVLCDKLPNIATYLSGVDTNPVSYL